MTEISLQKIGFRELSQEEAVQTKGGFLLALLAAWTLGYLIGRWIGGDPVPAP